MKLNLFLITIAGFMVASNAVAADLSISAPVANIQATAYREVQNDKMVVSLYSEKQGKSSAEVSDSLNKLSKWALDLSKETKNVKVATSDFNVYPEYSQQASGSPSKIVGWRGRISLSAESTDFDAVAKLSQKLQSNFVFSGISFSVSQKTKDALEEDLLKEASLNFKAKAKATSNSLGFKAFRIKEVSVGMDNGFQPPMPMMARGMRMEADSVGSAPQFEGGSSKLGLTISGSIWLD